MCDGVNTPEPRWSVVGQNNIKLIWLQVSTVHVNAAEDELPVGCHIHLNLFSRLKENAK